MLENGLNLFGIQILPTKNIEHKSAALEAEKDQDGAIEVASTGAAYNGIYLDFDGLLKDEFQAILKYREIAKFPEIDVAIQDIINEAIPQESDTPQVKLNLNNLDLSDELKEKINAEFEKLLSLLNYNTLSADLFKTWYIDGRLVYQVIVDKDDTKKGIIQLIQIDGSKIKKVKEIQKESNGNGVFTIKGINEYFVYSDNGFNTTQRNSNIPTSSQGVKLAKDSIIYVPSGYLADNVVLSYLHKAIRPANQLRMLEDATVVYFIARAPERRVFYVDVGQLPKLKAEQYLKDIMNRYRNKMVYDSKTGEVKDEKKHMTMLEDFWLPRREGGKGTEITTLPGVQNITGYLDSLEYFRRKLFESLNIPISRLQGENGFNLGRSSEITRDELKFQKFIDRLRMKFSVLFFDALRIQLILKGICNDKQWETIKQKISIDFQKDNYFSELKNQEVLSQRLELVATADTYLLKYFSKNWIQKNILKFSQEEIDKMSAEMQSEISDPSAGYAYTDPITGLTTDPGLTGQNGGKALVDISPAAASKSARAEIHLNNK